MTLAARARRLLGLPSPSADALRAFEHFAEALDEGVAAAGPFLHFPTLSPDSPIGYRMTTPTTKTLDLTTHAATFASTYDHARRMGADRPLSHRFALADVLGEIEKVIESRIADVVASERRRASREAETVRLRHASELDAARRTTVARSALPGGRYVADGTSVRDRLTGRRAPFGYEPSALLYAARLNNGTVLPESFMWSPR